MKRKMPPLVFVTPVNTSVKRGDKYPQIRTRRDIYLKLKDISERSGLPLREVVDRLLEYSLPYVEIFGGECNEVGG